MSIIFPLVILSVKQSSCLISVISGRIAIILGASEVHLFKVFTTKSLLICLCCSIFFNLSLTLNISYIQLKK